MRVLLVEDDPGVREALELGLSLEGHEVRAVDRPEEALGLLSWAEVVVLDVLLPQGDGFSLLRAIRERSEAGKAKCKTASSPLPTSLAWRAFSSSGKAASRRENRVAQAGSVGTAVVAGFQRLRCTDFVATPGICSQASSAVKAKIGARACVSRVRMRCRAL